MNKKNDDKKDDDKKNDGKKNDGKWRCPTCQVEADVKDREIHVYIQGQSWPLHYDCELAKVIAHIDFSKLEKIS